jgi:hypothetical protein
MHVTGLSFFLDLRRERVLMQMYNMTIADLFELENLFTIENIATNGEHWVVYGAHMASRTITYYDRYSNI